MAKFRHPSRLTKEEQERILFEFGEVLSKINNPTEALGFVKDLLSAQEAEMLAKRVKIAEYLLEGHRYDDIGQALKVSPNTIARVNEWLKYSGDGYRQLLKRLATRQKRSVSTRNRSLSPVADLRRKYPTMFWPQTLLEDVVRLANTRQKKRLRATLDELDKKSALYKRLDTAMRSSRTHPPTG
jgi:TrpR-related protein YerC/YecD